jgi:hypothetical protein
MADSRYNQFELVGQPDALPDALFEALAALVLDVSSSDELRSDHEEDAA